jgi:phosphoribosylanthranilate isomerase
MTLFVKLCGIAHERQLEAAVEAGADAVGFVLTPSPRQVSLEKAARLRSLLPSSVLGVAVFHDPAPALLRRAEEVIGPDLLQSELSTLAGVTSDRALPVVVDGRSLGRELARAARLTTREMVLVDSAAHGGTGQPPSWERVAAVDFRGRLILAGGLDADNVAEAVGLVRPFGVDVSSGIESAPGVKDPARMRAFVEAARGAVSPPAGGSTASIPLRPSGTPPPTGEEMGGEGEIQIAWEGT